MPFLDQMLYTFIITIVVILFVSLSSGEGDDNPKAIPLLKETFATGKVFNVAAYIMLILIAILYAIFW
jgi:SSS family solute:Na+ symporter